MSVIYIVLPLALILAAVALGAFFWAVRRGQFDDLETPAMRVLFDEADEEARGKAGKTTPPRGQPPGEYPGT